MARGTFVPNRPSQAAFMMQVRAVMVYRVNRACEEVRKTAQRNISGTGTGILYGSHRASAPGEFPALDTGVLRDSVKKTVLLKSNEVVGFVGTRERRGRFLEYGTRKMAPRPWLRRTLMSLKNRVDLILRGRA